MTMIIKMKYHTKKKVTSSPKNRRGEENFKSYENIRISKIIKNVCKNKMMFKKTFIQLRK